MKSSIFGDLNNNAKVQQITMFLKSCQQTPWPPSELQDINQQYLYIRPLARSNEYCHTGSLDMTDTFLSVSLVTCF